MCSTCHSRSVWRHSYIFSCLQRGSGATNAALFFASTWSKNKRRRLKFDTVALSGAASTNENQYNLRKSRSANAPRKLQLQISIGEGCPVVLVDARSVIGRRGTLSLRRLVSSFLLGATCAPFACSGAELGDEVAIAAVNDPVSKCTPRNAAHALSMVY
jgi:hypothetical protein